MAGTSMKAVRPKHGSNRPIGQVPPTSARNDLKFGPADGFHRELRHRVEQYFEATGMGQRDSPRMYLKTALILAWFGASYLMLVFFAETWWRILPLAISLGLSMAAIGFNIQH